MFHSLYFEKSVMTLKTTSAEALITLLLPVVKTTWLTDCDGVAVGSFQPCEDVSAGIIWLRRDSVIFSFVNETFWRIRARAHVLLLSPQNDA